jgi:DNA (cytosine-5)-methyltransferase 1
MLKRPDDHPELIDPTRERLNAAGVPWVIENVMGAPMRYSVVLCGEYFGLRVVRHRQFETSFLIFQPPHPNGHAAKTSTKKTRKDFAAGMNISATGDFGAWVGPACMGIDWMDADELAQSIPPAYTFFIGTHLLAVIGVPA